LDNPLGQDPFDLRIIRTTVLESAVETLRRAILTGHFKPGARLVEADLCAAIGISRASLREALRRLQAERLVDIIPNRGPIIPVMTWSEASQIFDVRRMLEAEAAQLAAQKAQPADIARARAALDRFATAVSPPELAQLIGATAEFYEAILNAGGNLILQELLRGLNARISFLRGRSMSTNSRAVHSLREMRAMIAAIEAGDVAAARAATIAHIDAAQAAARSAYGHMAVTGDA
jgi:DNA-binding GntR family transcriptional regulator